MIISCEKKERRCYPHRLEDTLPYVLNDDTPRRAVTRCDVQDEVLRILVDPDTDTAKSDVHDVLLSECNYIIELYKCPQILPP